MAGVEPPANPGTPRPAPAVKGTPGQGPANGIHCRSKATGQEAEFLHEAAARLESITSLLSAVALGHAPADVSEVLPPAIAVLDDAQRFVRLAADE